MAYQRALLRPLLRATSRQSLIQTASVTTTSRQNAAAAATSTQRATPAKSSTSSSYVRRSPASSTSRPAAPKAAPSKPAPAPTPVAPASSSADADPLPDAPAASYPAGSTTPFASSGGPPYQPHQQQQQPQPGQIIDWSTSYYGLGTQSFSKEVVDILLQPVNPADVEVKADGIIYLPEIKYRRILNAAFGPGGWGLVPKGEVIVGDKVVTREYALVAEGRFISQAQGENSYFALDSLPSAVEGCKSNALMRCCKDLGIASDLWDPVFIRQFKKDYAEEVWAEHVVSKKKKLIWTRKDVPVTYPYRRTN
ncbi:mitochondrial genome maintenance MGM101-domain-containing protein [Colletotrichum navitas]|uniref:Mitochondrial genome maintenance protein MGM101 n=1 Tax=Colletotrichum navitas TaxID=681940 RepID=A0AAD8PVI0_9PEZI|nr:mitochondrial genome maintenance MGM101-domain-containing protein [Colletotrichum navitas]KAK1580723.1 mitochondrial genome maintenance MGM101-domain-containing protein [Colletotrichum navitas]